MFWYNENMHIMRVKRDSLPKCIILDTKNIDENRYNKNKVIIIKPLTNKK